MEGIELVSQREAAWLLDVHHDLSRPRVTRLLATGIAGRPRRAGGALLYDAGRVKQLAGRRLLNLGDLEADLPRVVVARRAVDVLADREIQHDQLADGWNLNILDCLAMIWEMERTGPIPLVATVSGFVIMGAELTGFGRSRMAPGKRVRLLLQEAGPWFDQLRDARLDVLAGATFSLWRRDQCEAAPPKPIQLPSSSR